MKETIPFTAVVSEPVIDRFLGLEGVFVGLSLVLGILVTPKFFSTSPLPSAVPQIIASRFSTTPSSMGTVTRLSDFEISTPRIAANMSFNALMNVDEHVSRVVALVRHPEMVRKTKWVKK